MIEELTSRAYGRKSRDKGQAKKHTSSTYALIRKVASTRHKSLQFNTYSHNLDCNIKIEDLTGRAYAEGHL